MASDSKELNFLVLQRLGDELEGPDSNISLSSSEDWDHSSLEEESLFGPDDLNPSFFQDPATIPKTISRYYK